MKNFLLGGEDLLESDFGEVEELVELGSGVAAAFGGGLGFDEAAVGGHDDIHVDVGLGIFFVAEVEQGASVDDADGDGADHLLERGLLEGAGFDEGVEGEAEGACGAGNGCGAGSAVGLEDVAVEDNCSFTKQLHVDDGAQAAADEALDFMGAAADFAAFAFARGAGDGGAGKHGVLGGDPSAAGVTEPSGDALLDGGIGQDAGIAEADEDGSFGGLDEAGEELEGAQLVGGALAGAEQGGGVQIRKLHRAIVEELA